MRARRYIQCGLSCSLVVVFAIVGPGGGSGSGSGEAIAVVSQRLFYVKCLQDREFIGFMSRFIFQLKPQHQRSNTNE